MSRFQTTRRVGLLALTGQLPLLNRMPRGPIRRVLWHYDWNFMGDAIMDLSQRNLIDPRIDIDLCMPCGAVELFAHDRRFRRVHARMADCRGPYDLIVTQWLTTAQILEKLKHFPTTPWLSFMAHYREDDFCRIQLGIDRLRPYFGNDHWTQPAPTGWTSTSAKRRSPDTSRPRSSTAA